MEFIIDNKEIVIGAIAYFAVIGAFSMFGRFLKECDNDIPIQPHKKDEERP